MSSVLNNTKTMMFGQIFGVNPLLAFAMDQLPSPLQVYKYHTLNLLNLNDPKLNPLENGICTKHYNEYDFKHRFTFYELPKEEPYFFIALSTSSYLNFSEEQCYLDKTLPGVKALDSIPYENWKFTLYEFENKLFVSCRGSENILSNPHNWKDNFLRWTGDEQKEYIQYVDSVLKKWETEQGRKIYAITGHSGGGWWTSRLLGENQEIFRVTQNGHYTKPGQRSLNLRTTMDIVTLLHEKSHLITSCVGEHGIVFFEWLKGKTWKALGLSSVETGGFIADSFIKPKGESKIGEVAHEIYPKATLPQADTSLDALQLSLKEDQEKIPAGASVSLVEEENFIKDIELSEQYCSLFDLGVEVLEGAVRTVAGQFIHEQERKLREFRTSAATQQMENQFERNKRRIKDSAHEHSRSLAFSEVCKNLTLQIHPGSISNDFLELGKIRDEINRTIKELNESLASIPELQNALELQEKDLDKLDAHQKHLYNTLLKNERSLRKENGKLNFKLSLVSNVLSHVEPLRPIVSTVSAVANAGINGMQTRSEKRTHKIQQSYNDQQQQSLETRYLIEAEQQRLKDKLHQIAESKEQIRRLLINNQNIYTSKEHIEKVKTAQIEMAKEISNATLTLENKKNDLAEKNAKLQNLNQKREETIQYVLKSYDSDAARPSLMASYKKEVKKVNGVRPISFDEWRAQSRQKTIDGITKTPEHIELEVAVIKLGEEIKDDNTKLSGLTTTSKDLDTTLDEANEVAPLRELRDIFNYREVDPNKAFKEAFYEDYEAGTKRNNEYLVPALGISNAVADILKAFPSLHASQYGNLLTNIGKITELTSNLSVSIKALDTAIKTKGFLEAVSALGATALIGTIFVPVLQIGALMVGTYFIGKYFYERYIEGKEDVTDLKQMIDHMSEVGKHLEKLINHRLDHVDLGIVNVHKDMLLQFSDLTDCLAALENNISREISLGNEEIKQVIFNQSYCDFMERIYKGITHTDKSFLKLKLKGYHGLSENLENFINITVSPPYAGFIPTSGGQFTAKVDTALLHQNPDALTGLIAAHLGVRENIPNWLFLENLIRNIILIFDDKLISHLENDSTQLKSLLFQLENLQKIHSNIEVFFDLGGVLQQLVSRYSGIWEKLEKQANNTRNLKTQFEERLLLDNIEKYKSVKKFSPLGLSRFYLCDIVNNERFYNEERTQCDKWMPFMCPTAAKVGRVALGLGLCSTIILIPVGVGEITNICKSEHHLRLLKKLNDSDQTLKEISIENSGKDTFPSMSLELRKELLVLEDERRIAKYHEEAYMNPSFVVYLNLSLRKIQSVYDCSCPRRSTNYSFSCIHSRAFVAIGVKPRSSYYSLDDFELQVEEKSFKLKEIQLIPNSGLKLPELYNKRITNLQEDFLTFIDCILNKKDVPQTNVLVSLLPTARLIKSKSEKLPPLIFPENLISNLENALGDTRNFLELTNNGLFLCEYEFDKVSKSLNICFSYLDNESKSHEYCKFTVAKIEDNITLESYIIDLTQLENKKYLLVELLIQFLYGSYVGLGMPGSGSYHHEYTSLVAPHEIPFEGLYNIWLEHNLKPENVHTSCIKFDALSFVEGEEKSLLSPVGFKGCSSLARTVKMALGARKDLQQTEQLYKKDFSILRSMISLLSNMDVSTFYKELENEFGLVAPDKIDSMYQYFAEGRPRKVTNSTNVLNFLELVNCTPSQRIETFNQQQDALDTIVQALKEHITGKKISLNLPQTPRVSAKTFIKKVSHLNAQEKPSASQKEDSLLKTEDKIYQTTMLDDSLPLSEKVALHNSMVLERKKKNITVFSDVVKRTFAKFLSNYFDRKDVDHDGDCLFTSLGHFINFPAHTLRRELCEIILNESSFLEDSFVGGKTAYVKKMQEKAVWGDEVEIRAFQFYLKELRINKQIQVFDVMYCLNVRNGKLIPRNTCYGDYSDQSITIVRENETHFSILIPK